MSNGFRLLVLLATLSTTLVAACGGDDGSPNAEEAAVPVQEVPPARYRDSLTMADLGVLERDDILLAIPWTTNRISKNPDVGPAGATALERVEITPERGFDRIALHFSTRIPGFSLQESPDPITDCGTGDEADVPGEARLLLRLDGATTRDDEGGALRDPSRTVDQDALNAFVLTCDSEGTVEIGLGVTGPVEWRALEMGNEPLLVLDLRVRPEGSSDAGS